MKAFLSLGTLAAGALLVAAGCSHLPPRSAKNYFIDVHEFGPGNVTAAAVARAHEADLKTQHKHGVHFIEYWVDEKNGAVYCLSEAGAAPDIVAAHREAHGLLPARILSVSSGEAAPLTGSKPLFLDVHELGAGNVTAKGVAAAHEKDLAEQSQHDVRFVNYWVDEVNGKVLCLSEAPDSDAVRETHRHAHGLLPASIVRVTRGE